MMYLLEFDSVIIHEEGLQRQEAKENSHTFVRLCCWSVMLNFELMVDCKAFSVFGFLLLHLPKEHLILIKLFGIVLLTVPEGTLKYFVIILI